MTKKCRSVFLAGAALLAVLAGPVQAQTALSAGWTPLGPFGGPVHALTTDPSRPGVVYATSNGLGVFRSADAGNSWTAIFGGDVHGSMAVDPADPSVLYVLADPGVVWKSVDSGAHWSAAGRGLPTGTGWFQLVAVDPARHNRVYLGSIQGVWRSVNGGASWQSASNGLPSVPFPSQVTALAAVRRPEGTAFVGTVSGLFRTTDGGASWQRLTRGLPANVRTAMVTALAASPSDPQILYVLFLGGRLYRTRDGGGSWQEATGFPRGQEVTSLGVDPRSSATLYASLRGGQVLRSTDGAGHWSAAGRLPGPFPWAVLAPDPFTRRRLYAGLLEGAFPGGAFRSDDGGATWQRRSEGLSALGAFSLAVDPADPDRLWTGENSYLFRSANGGRRWIRLAVPGGFLFPAPNGQISVGHAAAVFVKTLQIVPLGSSILFKTEDNGASWTHVFGPLERFQVFLAYRIAPSDPATLYALADVEPIQPGLSLLRSTDSGGSWQTRATGLLLDCGFGQLAIAPSSADTLYATGSASVPPLSCAGPNSRVLRSRDGGATWTDVSAGLPARGFVARAAVDPDDPDVLYVGFQPDDFSSTRGAWKSSDGGATWKPAGGELAGRFIGALLATAVPGRVYAAVDGGRVFRSEDGGEHWEDVTGRLVTRSIFELVPDPSDPARIYAATWSGVWVLEDEP